MHITESFTLETDDILLSVLTPKDDTALEIIAQDLRIWIQNPNFSDPKEFRAKWFEHALRQQKQGKRIPFVIHYQHKVIGSTSFYDIDAPQQITIGYTWLHPDYWGKGINTIVKHMLLNYLFDTAHFSQVNFVIDRLNLRSRKAVEKLGAAQQDIIINHMQRPDGTMRDSVIYSIFAKKSYQDKSLFE